MEFQFIRMIANFLRCASQNELHVIWRQPESQPRPIALDALEHKVQGHNNSKWVDYGELSFVDPNWGETKEKSKLEVAHQHSVEKVRKERERGGMKESESERERVWKSQRVKEREGVKEKKRKKVFWIREGMKVADREREKRVTERAKKSEWNSEK